MSASREADIGSRGQTHLNQQPSSICYADSHGLRVKWFARRFSCVRFKEHLS